MFGVSSNTIRWGNDIDTNDVINPGDRLVILPINGVRHTVEKGDTIKSIAKKYEGDVDEILRFNELTADSEISVGDVVVVPNGEVHRPKASSGGTYAKASVSSDYFINPVPGSVITQYLHGYNAIDLGARSGSSVYASASGEVIVSKEGGWNGGYGNYVVIRHSNGTQTLYSHLASNSVYVGQYVSQGDIIGYVGATGRATGPHLHFEVRGAVNPFNR
ncbi:MAG: LysM peptidoglycan-binding domain-containing M23 family metallopeptidase [Candidatus Pacebacteria bacterium]|nr:LysM peptidoglycan-binding domain-containing M23 family metallopeptidase [Candidatus Paceibacterota bacterium]